MLSYGGRGYEILLYRPPRLSCENTCKRAHERMVEKYFYNICLCQSFSLYPLYTDPNVCCSLADMRFVIRSYGFVLHRLHVSKHQYYIRWVHIDGYKTLIRVREL